MHHKRASGACVVRTTEFAHAALARILQLESHHAFEMLMISPLTSAGNGFYDDRSTCIEELVIAASASDLREPGYRLRSVLSDPV
jgi:hypothetical protein